ncbi:MAG: glycoside hydrolase family 140 protein, partial [Prevotellaceae bacterium]|nr:glycoside hydrolase family 140 protein [Prevotellaceae bacterium]
REDTEKYLQDRKEKGFNIIQTSVLHYLNVKNAYGSPAVVDSDPSKPYVTPGSNPDDSVQYDYWDHVDYAIDLAAEKGMYVGIVPVWGTNVKNGDVSREQAEAYAKFLATRYADKNNVAWLNGGDIVGTDSMEIWNIMGNTLRKYAPNHLITFHPFGRSRSSQWFHDAPWLNFNMIQSGHRTYEQDPNKIGQDTWKHITIDYNLKPTKPTLDGEPSYENIPYGLHDWHLEKNVHLRPANYKPEMEQPLWQAADVRRYAYWSVLAGGCGFTYGHNSIMQMHIPTDTKSAYNSRVYWYDALDAEGATQMKYVKDLMLSRSYFDRVPDQSLVANQGEKYNTIIATRGNDYIFVYTYNGRPVKLNMGKLKGCELKASWFNPRNGEVTKVDNAMNTGVAEFIPPVKEIKDGNDWVLILDEM